MDNKSQRSTLFFLSEEEKDKIYQTILQVLGEVGMQILHDEALALLKTAGCEVVEDHMVKIPSSLVEKAIKSAPNNIAIHDRQGNHAMDLGGYRTYFGTGSDLIYAMNSEKMERRLCVLADVERSAIVGDALSNIDFIMSFAHPSDVTPQRAYLASFQAMVENSTKPIVCTAECRNDLRKIWEIAVILRESEDKFRLKPYFIHYAEPISPLMHPFHSLDKLLFCAEKGIPVIYSPAPIAGSTAPMTIAGHVAQGLAECFCGLVIHQLKAEGAPFIMGMGPAVLDMATSECSYNAPEYYLAYITATQMYHYFDLPSWGYAGTSDSQVPDEQATFEGGLSTFISAMSGANLNHDVGYLDFGKTGSLEMIVVMDEVIDQTKRLMRGVPVNDEMLGLDVIREAGHKGDYLTHDHTLKHLRSVQWRPKLISREGHEKWKESGKPTLLGRARKRLLEIFDTHKPIPLSNEKSIAIKKLVDRFKI